MKTNEVIIKITILLIIIIVIAMIFIKIFINYNESDTLDYNKGINNKTEVKISNRTEINKTEKELPKKLSLIYKLENERNVDENSFPNSRIVMDSNSKGDLVFVWRDDNKDGIIGKILYLNGNEKKFDIALDYIYRNTPVNEGKPLISFLNNEKFIVAWERRIENGYYSEDVIAKIFDINGNELKEIEISEKDFDKAFELELDVRNNEIIFVWTEGKEKMYLYARKFDFNGNPLTNAENLYELPDNFWENTKKYCENIGKYQGMHDNEPSAFYPSVSLDKNKNAFIVWKDTMREVEINNKTTLVYGAFSNIARVFNKDLNPKTDILQIDHLNMACENHHQISNSWLPYITSVKDKFVVINQVINYNYYKEIEENGWLKLSRYWYNNFRELERFENPPDMIIGSVQTHLFISIYDNNGIAITENIKIDSGDSVFQHPFSRDPKNKYIAATNNDGIIIVVWTDLRNGDKDIYGKLYDEYGRELSNDFLIEKNSESPYITNKNNNFLISYINHEEGPIPKYVTIEVVIKNEGEK